MADTNGGGRMDRIEAALDKLADRQPEFAIIQERDHEEHQRDFKQLMTWQVLRQEKMEADRIEDRARQKQFDERVDRLVSAIWHFIASMPSPPLAKPPAVE